MIGKPARIMAWVGLAVLALAAWHVASAKDEKQGKSDKVVLPPAAAAAVKQAFPKATINEVEREREGVVLYEVRLKQDGKEVEVEVSPDGQIVEVSREVARGDLPEAVAKALAKLAGDAKIKEIEKEEVHAVVKLVKLARPLVVYEAEFVRNGKEVEVKLSSDGKLLGKEVEDDDDD